jgi:hypothetical protein
MPSGGYRKPENPAAVSGPGAKSKRTDGRQPVMDLPDAEYGGNKQFREIQQGAPLPQQGAPPAQGQPVDLSQIVGLDQPTQQPETPVTAGAQYGPGPGEEALGQRSPNAEDAKFMEKNLPVLLDIAQREDTPPGFKRWVRKIVANL